uniref:Zinc finger, CCHC-type n=1 Tax=Tanacetum cinerariifolium TaxID=118510 RepID=A0A699I6N6_TANCI|nr:zinc finger, CCHC-type [Tanacetum cinerariifolium]
MHSIGKTVNELHVMLKLHEQTLPPKEVAPTLHVIRAGRIYKNQKKKSYKAAKGNQGKGKAKMGYAHVQMPPFAPKPKNLPTPKKEYPAKDVICHQCGEVGYWRRNYPIYLSELMKKKKLSQGASTSGIFTIELSFPNTSWIYDTMYGTHICITTHGLKGSRKLKSGALSLYVGDGHRAAVEAIGDYHLSTRTRRLTDRLCLHVDAEEHELGDLDELANYKAALLDLESDKWINAMNVEMQSMKGNEVWELVVLPLNGKIIGHKWLFKKKTDMDGAVHTYKADLVPKGFTQTPGIDYKETFSLVVDIRTIRILIAIAAFYDYKI